MLKKNRFWTGILASLVSAGILLSSLAPTSIAGTGDIPDQIIEWSQNNVMLVDPDNASTGSGFWYNNEYFVTACHVVSEAYDKYTHEPKSDTYVWVPTHDVKKEAQVSSNDMATVLNLKVETCDLDTDVAILSRQWLASDSDFTAINTKLADPIPDLGDTVYGAGYGLKEFLHFTVGHWQGNVRAEKDPHRYIITAPTIFGDSGSPALVLRDGEVQIAGIRQSARNAGNQLITHLVGVSDSIRIQMELEKARK